MPRKKRILRGLTILLTLLIGIPALWFYREVQHVRKNQELIAAIKAGDKRKALEALASGADGSARDTGKSVSLGDILLRLLNKNSELKQEEGEKHLAAILLPYEQTYEQPEPHELDPELIKALLDHGACLNKQDMGIGTLLKYSPAGSNTVEILDKRAEAEYPADHGWPEYFGEIYFQKMNWETGSSRRKSATLAQAAYERALPYIKSVERREWVLTATAHCAFEADDLAKARAYAEKEVQEAPRKPVHSPGVYSGYDNTFFCHLLLGRLALCKGDRKEAKAQLLAAGSVPMPNTSGFCWLGPFGQTSPLVQELLKKGERKTVLEYFRLCNKSGHDTVLLNWTKAVQAGKIPDFCPIP